MPDLRHVGADEGGYVLVMVLVTLLLLIVIGITATSTTMVEVQIAGNDKVNKQTFYGADAGTEVAARMVEENIACGTGFTVDPTDAAGRAIINNTIAVPAAALAFWRNEAAVDPSDVNRHLYYPQDYAGSDPHTNITVSGQTRYVTGAAIQMVSGYEGKGKGAASGGGYIRYNLVAQRIGVQNSESEVEIIWRHNIGLEGDCRY